MLLLGVGVVLASWLVLILLARRLPPGLARDLANFLPACATTLRRLRKDPRVPFSARIAVAIAAVDCHHELGATVMSGLAAVELVNALGLLNALEPLKRGAATCGGEPTCMRHPSSTADSTEQATSR